MSRVQLIGGVGPVICDCLGSDKNETMQVSHSFTMPAGAAAPGRALALVVRYNAFSAMTFSSVTIGGISALPELARQQFSTNERGVVFFLARVDTAATSVTVAFTASVDVNLHVSIYRLENLQSLTPFDTAGNEGAGVTSVSLNIDTEDEGALLAGAYTVNPAVPGFTAGVTQDAVDTFSAVSGSIAGHTETAAESGRTVTATRVSGAAGTMNIALAAVSLR